MIDLSATGTGPKGGPTPAGMFTLGQNRLTVPDGDFGGSTETAVRTVQSWHGLSADGRFGPRTSAALWFQAYDHNNGGSHTRRCFQR